MSTENKSGSTIAIIVMFFLFGMVAFVTNMAAPFGNIWGYTYSWSGMMGNMMNFLAYLFMGIPAGKMLETKGYKKTALIAMVIGLIGLFIQYLSSIFGADIKAFEFGGQVVAMNLVIYLLGAFVCGFCVCMLNTVVNPMLNLLGGGGNKGNQLIQAGGSINSLCGTVTPMLVGVLIGEVTEKTAMSDVAPLLFIGMAVFAISFVVIYMATIPEPKSSASEGEKSQYSAWSFRHFLFGVGAIFCYVGAEVGIPAQLNFYVSDPAGLNNAVLGGSLAGAYWFLMMLGRMGSTAISGKISAKMQLSATAGLGIVLLLAAIFLPESVAIGSVPFKCYLIVACGLCTSVMWGCIFNLAVEGLGKYTAAASGIFMMMVVGGGVWPLIQDLIGVNLGRMTSYWIPIALFAYILFFAVAGSKNVNKDIPVE